MNDLLPAGDVLGDDMLAAEHRGTDVLRQRALHELAHLGGEGEFVGGEIQVQRNLLERRCDGRRRPGPPERPAIIAAATRPARA